MAGDERSKVCLLSVNVDCAPACAGVPSHSGWSLNINQKGKQTHEHVYSMPLCRAAKPRGHGSRCSSGWMSTTTPSPFPSRPRDSTEVRRCGIIGGTHEHVQRFIKQLQAAHPDATLKFCYEAGPRGFPLVPVPARAGPRVHHRVSLAGAAPAGRPGEDRSARCGSTGAPLSRGRTHRHPRARAGG